ncbi:unnamed protein product [Adineta steineri]|uniref:NAD(P)(+)--arginine ADP-ribosyltransferase n=1 Tax=Adineta steineri TaxID=433720 RepID=A0A818MFC1_9BILA|nr:unnamed protein product [Adineta steineri]CAF3589545.1 unnamed protein product [Adineta steineri]
MSESKSDKHAVASSDIHQLRQRMVQNYLLVWVDAGIDQANTDWQITLAQLKNVVDDVRLCTEPNQCVQVFNQIDSERVFVITSGSVGQHLVPEIHGMPQLDAIYILCGNRSKHQEWAQTWTKIKGVYTKIQEICHALESAVKQCNQNSIAVSFLTVNEMASTENLNQLEPTFMYTQIIKEILLDMEHGKQAIKQFTTYCRNNNSMSQQNIDRFEKEYDTPLAIWWYTFPSNIYYMLNCALRFMEGDTIINMGFFIHDLHQQIQQLHQQQARSYHDKSFIVYRGQALSKANFEKLKNTEAGLMSFNNFLSTSTEEDIALSHTYSASENVDMVGILFIMSIDPCKKSVPFASIKDKSYFMEENEILFSMHTIFRVVAIKQMDNKNQLYQVELQLTSDDDQQLQLLTNRIREEAVGTGWERLGSLLLKIGQYKNAEELYNVLLEHTSDEGDNGHFYACLGDVKHQQGDHEKAIWYYEKALEIQPETLLSNHPSVAISYSDIGLVYDNMGEYSKALSYHEKALKIREKTLPTNHLDFAQSYNNIGSAYDNMGEYSKALLCYENALEIEQKTLPSNHPDLATLYNNIGSVYNSMGEYSKAFSSHEKALEIREKTLSSNHPDLAQSYSNIGNVHQSMGEHSKALSLYEKALEIYYKTLSSNHPDLAQSYNNIGNVHQSMREYSEALSFYEKALEIREKTLSSNHPSLAVLYNNIGLVYSNMRVYSKALSYHEKALGIREKTLSSNHPSLAISYNNIGLVYGNMGDNSKALSSNEKALKIREKTLSSNHPSLAISYNNIGMVYSTMGEYSKALSYFEQALRIWQRAFPPTHPHIESVKKSIEIVEKKL